MANETANYVFLPWVRQGAAAGIQTPDNPDNSANADPAGVVTVEATLQVNGAHPVTRTVRLHGPGDVTGIDPQQVIRTEPRHLAQDFEPNYFPAIEFDRPDFPWLFTPAKAAADGRLRPWLCLVVVRKQGGGTLRTGPGQLLPVLETRIDELPELSESWAWAHAQVAGSPKEDLGSALGGDPALTLSRLLCPRRLDPNTEYLACVVPAFDLGRKAGLGEKITAEDEKKPLQLAWPPKPGPPPDVVKLPVYYHWEFRTGTGGDFEALVSLLTPPSIPEEHVQRLGKRTIDISQSGIPLPPGTTLEFEGALRVQETKEAEWPEATRAPFQSKLVEILNAPWLAMKNVDREPLLGPPIYGCWQANQHIVEVAPQPPAVLPSPPWLHELNLDPRYRAAAALGTLVVQDQQEQLVAAAWEQLGEIQRINQMQRQAQLARAVNGVFHAKHLANFSPDQLLNVVAPAQSRLVVAAAGPVVATAGPPVAAAGPSNGKARTMLAHSIAQSALPDRAVSAPMRRLTNPRGAISVRFQQTTRPIAMVARLNTAESLVPSQRKPAGWVTINRVSDQPEAGLTQAIRFERISSALDSERKLSKFNVAAEGNTANLPSALADATASQPGSPDSPAAAVFRQAAQDHQDYLNQSVFRTIWQTYRFVFSGGNGIIYGVDHRDRLLFYRDQAQGGTSEVALPAVIGQDKWRQFKFVFSGGNGDIYGVDPTGQLLLFHDQAQNGTGVVANHEVIGPPDFGAYVFLFSGGNGILYAVNDLGQLVFYRDRIHVPSGDPIGQGGWQEFKFVFSGGDGIIYAVNQQGQLLFFRDENRDGRTGKLDVDDGHIIGEGWQDFKFLFSGGDGIIYAVDELGQLLITRDQTQDGTGTVALPTPVDSIDSHFRQPLLDLPKTKAALLQNLDPAKTIQAKAKASFTVSDGAPQNGNGFPAANDLQQGGDPLEPLQDSPVFPQPMYEVLRDLSQEFLFPGLEHIPPNSVILLEPNGRFVESFLVGLNAELSRELLWRGFPANLRSTYFRQFWDGVEPDIQAINEWENTGLGQNSQSNKNLVLLIRGELLRRYPNTVIYAVKAVSRQELSRDPGEESHPIFRGTLKPDITFLGFPLTRKQVIGDNATDDPGWFFVIQEQPTEPRFGLDAANFEGVLTSPTAWSDLSWRHFAETTEELKALSHVSAKALPKTVTDGEIDKVRWGKNAAHQAFITWQRPVRVAIHASQLIPEG